MVVLPQLLNLPSRASCFGAATTPSRRVVLLVPVRTTVLVPLPGNDRKRNQKQKCRSMLEMNSSSSSSSSRRQQQQQESLRSIQLLKNFNFQRQERVEPGGDDDGAAAAANANHNNNTSDEKSNSWLTWMTGGKRSKRAWGVEEIKMREEEAWGGVPRADRYSSRDWWHNTVSLPSSAILKNVIGPVTFMSMWATFISVLYRALSRSNRYASMAQHMCIPTTAHSLMVSSLGLLLVFRTNSAYQRFAEGRKIWEDILNSARDLSRLAKLYETQIGVEKRRRIQRLLAAFPYLLRHRIRPNLVMRKLDDTQVERDPVFSLLLYQDSALTDNDAEAAAVANDEELTGRGRRKTRPLFWVDKRTLPWRLLPEPGAMQSCARAQNRPLWVCDRLSKELWSVPDQDNYTARERLTFIGHVDKLSRTIGSCERIHQTVVPLNYARHALRSLTFWLLSLPFCLIKDLGLLTGPVLCIVSWMLFGVYEIGYSIEDPFQGTLRLSILCDAIRRDVLQDELIRDTAFTLDPEPGEPEEEEDDDEYDSSESRRKKEKKKNKR